MRSAPYASSDAEYLRVYREVVMPIAKAYDPQLVLVSAGFDAYDGDPLAGMRVTAEGFHRILTSLRDAAAATCGSRVMLVTEGGYDLPGLTAGIEAGFDVFGARR